MILDTLTTKLKFLLTRSSRSVTSIPGRSDHISAISTHTLLAERDVNTPLTKSITPLFLLTRSSRSVTWRDRLYTPV